MPKSPPTESSIIVIEEPDWYTTAPPEGTKTVEIFGKDYGNHEIKFVLWADSRGSCLHMPAPIAGPRTKVNGRSWKLYVQRVAYHVSVAMGGSVDSRFNLQPVTDNYLKTKLIEGDEFWTKLYAKMTSEFEIPLDPVPQPVAAGASIRALQSKIGCLIDDSSKVKIVGETGIFDHDELSGQIRSGGNSSLIFVIDLVTLPKPPAQRGLQQWL